MRDLKTTLGVLLVASLVLSAPLYGQRGSTDIPQPAIDGKRERTKSIAEQERPIKVRVNEVIVPVTVLNSKGEMIFDLKKDNFHIYDNGVEQVLEQFDIGGDRLAVALVMETSSHIQMMSPAIRGMGTVFTETVMALEGRAAVITYDSTVEVRN